MQNLPSRELTYPPKMAFWVDDFPFPKVGYVNSLEGSTFGSTIESLGIWTSSSIKSNNLIGGSRAPPQLWRPNRWWFEMSYRFALFRWLGKKIQVLHPGRLTAGRFHHGGLEDHFPFFSWVICRFHVNLPGCIQMVVSYPFVSIC